MYMYNDSVHVPWFYGALITRNDTAWGADTYLG